MELEKINQEFEGGLDLTLAVFKNEYPKTFLHELISSQLDMDRLDYLQRDSFFTGVVEGRINAERIIEMLNVSDSRLTVDEKGIYSVEKFIVSRRFMYWQVYFHKTSFMFEKVLEQTLRRAKMLYQSGKKLYLDAGLEYFFERNRFDSDGETIRNFSLLTDSDILFHLKKWTGNSDRILSFLSRTITERKPMRIEISKEPFSRDYVEKIKMQTLRYFNVDKDDLSFLVLEGEMSNTAYDRKNNPISVSMKSGGIKEFSEVTDYAYIQGLSRKVTKYFMIYPKNL
jgi:HD superfamily phosphohydrolase